MESIQINVYKIKKLENEQKKKNINKIYILNDRENSSVIKVITKTIHFVQNASWPDY